MPTRNCPYGKFPGLTNPLCQLKRWAHALFPLLASPDPGNERLPVHLGLALAAGLVLEGAAHPRLDLVVVFLGPERNYRVIPARYRVISVFSVTHVYVCKLTERE